MILSRIKSLITEEKSKDDVYQQRNNAVLMALKGLDEAGYEVGYKEADDTNPEWIVVWAKLPQNGDEKQVAWHMKRDILSNIDFLEKKHIEYDGHSDNQKRIRIQKFFSGIGR